MKKLITLLIAIFSILSLVSCDSSSSTVPKPTPEDENILLEVFESLEIEIDTLEVEGIEIAKIEEGIEKLYPEKIESVEITVVPINDEVISLVRAELIQHYGADVDIDKLLKDVLIASAVFVVDVVVTAASIIAAPATGGSSAAVGTTILMAVTKVAKTVLDVSTKAAAIISTIGMAVDAAIEGVKAYNEGGDISYILGHALNGVVDGLKWAMLFYPFSLGVDKVVSTIAQKRLLSKATQYIDDIAKVIPNSEEKMAKEIFKKSMKNADEILDIVNKAAKAGNVTTEVYDAVAKLATESIENTTDIGKVLFEMFSQDRMDLYKLLRSFNPYDNIAKVTKKLQEGFLDISGETFEALRTALVKKTIKSLDDDLIIPFKSTILENLDEFQTLFGNIISDEIKKDILAECMRNFGKNITKESAVETVDTLFAQLKKDGNLVEALKKISSNSSESSKSLTIVKKMLNDTGVYNVLASSTSAKKMKICMLQLQLIDNLSIYSKIADKNLIALLDNILRGEINNIDEIFRVLNKGVNDMGEIIAPSTKKLSINYVSFKQILESLDKVSQNKDLLKSIAKTDLKYNYKIADDSIELILSSKNYSDEVIDILSKNCLEQDSYILKYIDDFSTSGNLKSVINKTFKDANLSDEVIEKIRRGTSILEIFDESEYSTAIKLLNSLKNVNESLGSQFQTNFINDYKKVVVKYFEKVVEDNHIVRNKIASQLLSDLGYDSTDVVLKIMMANSESAFDTQLCHEVTNIYNFAKTLGTNRSSHKVVDASQLSIVIDNLFEGSINSSDDILSLLNKEAASIVSNNFTYGEALISSIQQLNIPNSDKLIKNIQVLSIASKLNNTVDGYKMADVVADVINNKLTYEEIVNKYSYKVYYNFVEHGDLIISKMVMSQDDELSELITKLSIDSLNKAINEGTTTITNEMLQSIVSGTPLNQISGLTDNMIVDNYSYLFNYAKATNSTDLLNQIVDARTRYFSSLGIVESTLNQEYAGGTFTTILGDVNFTSNGHVVLDSYAIAAVTLDLTGDSSKDIAKANKLFFGTSIGPQGYTWHHLEDGRTLILVPTSVHENVKHTGGAHYLRNYYDILFK